MNHKPHYGTRQMAYNMSILETTALVILITTIIGFTTLTGMWMYQIFTWKDEEF